MADTTVVEEALEAVDQTAKSYGMLGSTIMVRGRTVGIKLCLPMWSVVQRSDQPGDENEDGQRFRIAGMPEGRDAATHARRVADTVQALYLLRTSLTEHAEAVASLIHELREGLGRMGLSVRTRGEAASKPSDTESEKN